MAKKNISVIGFGAAGAAAAIEAATYIAEHDLDITVTVYEQLQRPLKKILATGNGRCNIMNANADIDKYNGDRRLIGSIFSRYSPESNTEFFRKMGLYLAQEEDGRLYPMSFQAASVADALRLEAERLGVEIRCGVKIETVKRDKAGFVLNERDKTDALIVAGGGKSSPVHGSDGSCYALLSSLGLRIKPVFPSLTGIILKRKNKLLKGTRAHGEILIVENGKVAAAASGELQYTDYGVSGIPAMEVSRAVSQHFALGRKGKVVMAINSLPDFPPEEIYSYIKERKRANEGLTADNLLCGLMPKKLGLAKLDSAGIPHDLPLGSLTRSQMAVLTEVINSDIFEVGGVMGFDHSQVSAGGADVSMFEVSTLEAKKVKGLFACGELLDVDGPCGGYNLAWAWSSGRQAGMAAAQYIAEKT